MVLLVAQGVDGTTEEPPLHPHLHHERHVTDQHLEGDHGATHITPATDRFGETVGLHTGVGQSVQSLQGQLPVLLHRQSGHGGEVVTS